MIAEFLFLSPVFLTALALVIAATVVLFAVEKSLKRKLREKEDNENFYFQRKINSLKNSKGNPQERLVFINSFAREFFQEEYGSGKKEKYSDLITLLKKKQGAAEFCEMMQTALYSGEKVSSEKISQIIKILDGMIERRISEKKELKRINLEKNLSLGGKIIKSLPKLPSIETGLLKNFNIKKYINLSEAPKEDLIYKGVEASKVHKGAGYENNFKGDIKLNHTFAKGVESAGRSILVTLSGFGKNVNRIVDESILKTVRKTKNAEHTNLKKSDEESFWEKSRPVIKGKITEVIHSRKKNAKMIKKVKYPKREPKIYKLIGGVDDLNRVKDRIKIRRKLSASEEVLGEKNLV